MRADIIILNSKEKKHLRQQLEEQYGITKLFADKILFCINKKEKLYICNAEIFEQEQDKLRVNAFGLYVGTFMTDGFRLSLEGVQLLGPQATKNVLELDIDKRDSWIRGEEIYLDTKELDGNYVLVKWNTDFIGCGKVKDGLLLNYLSKSRKLTNIFRN